MGTNESLSKARVNQEDEFYTKMKDIKEELQHYTQHFAGKVVYCNCNNDWESNFFSYFYDNFAKFKLKKLVTVSYGADAHKFEYDGTVIDKTKLKGNGDFLSQECKDILATADIVVDNPPFSQFRLYMSQLIDSGKKFLIVGSQNAITYKQTFQLLKDNKVWLGVNYGDMEFTVPDFYEPRETRYREEDGVKYRSLGNICWFTNMNHYKRNNEMKLYKKYDSNYYRKYDNSNVLNVNKVSEIPKDWNGLMGVPITFMNKYNPNQFEIIGIANSARSIGLDLRTIIDDKKIYNRIIIKKK